MKMRAKKLTTSADQREEKRVDTKQAYLSHTHGGRDQQCTEGWCTVWVVVHGVWGL